MRFVQVTAAAAWIVLALAPVTVAAAAGPAVEPSAIASGADLLRLDDGRLIRLAGIHVPQRADDAAAAQRAVAALIERAPITLDPSPWPLDRHGRLRVQVHTADGKWLQGELVARGLALAAPAPDVPGPIMAQLLALEQTARAAGLGLWARAESGPWPAERVAVARGSYVLVRGRVQQVARAQDFVYLNFGADWHRDFTIRAEAREAARLAKSGLDLERLEGRTVEVRGVLFEANGPMIELSQPAQIEVLE